MTRTEQLNKLQKSNQKLRAQVRQLRKQLKDANNELLLLQDLWQSEIAELKKQRRNKIKQKKTPVCPECGNPTLEIKAIGIWRLSRCQSCDYFSREQKED